MKQLGLNGLGTAVARFSAFANALGRALCEAILQSVE